MALNPQLVNSPPPHNHAVTSSGQGLPAPVPVSFGPHEHFFLLRNGVMLSLDGLGPSASAAVKNVPGVIYLSNVRMVFVLSKPDASAGGMYAFDFPLAYIRTERFHQPIFGANNLTANCFSTADDGGPNGARPPHALTLYFREGGVGTFLPLFFQLVQQARDLNAAAPPPPGVSPVAPTPAQTSQMVQTAYIDPNDPTQVYLVTGRGTQPSAPPLIQRHGW
mmetsp:Transcript_16247/g.41405  ORF Transcript_16247/g.41405 Transcript_16247/m.41405 type:complete len:221 (-) Transcript_16247:74-736(-)